MELNEKLINLLKNGTGLPVEQDEYDGKENKYIVFIYEDERPSGHADNKPYADTVYLQVQLITPKNYNYFYLKRKIRNLLEGTDFFVTSTRSFLGSVYVGTEKIRQTVFKVEYTEGRQEEE